MEAERRDDQAAMQMRRDANGGDTSLEKAENSPCRNHVTAAHIVDFGPFNFSFSPNREREIGE